MKFSEFFDKFFQPRFESTWGSPFENDDHSTEFHFDDIMFDDNFDGMPQEFGNHGNHFGNHGNHFGDIFSMMDRMMRDFHPHSFGNKPQVEPSPKKSLRDEVLKQPHGGSKELPVLPNNKNMPVLPENNHFNSILEEFFGHSLFSPYMESSTVKSDTDLDSQVSQHGLEAVLDRETPPIENSFKSTSESIVMNPDGSSVRQTKVTDHRGDTITTIVKESPSGETTTEVITAEGGHRTLDEKPNHSSFLSGIFKDFFYK